MPTIKVQMEEIMRESFKLKSTLNLNSSQSNLDLN